MTRPTLHLLLLASLLAPACSQATEVEMGFSHDALDKGYTNWSSTYLDGAHRFGERHTIYGELRETRRFDQQDRELSGGYYYPFNAAWTGLLEASVSPEHKVLPKHSLFGQLQKSFDNGWNAQAGLRHTQYNTAATDLMVLTGERYWGDYRAAYKFYLGKPQGAGAAASHLGQLSYYYGERDSFTLSLSQGNQVENLGAGVGVLTTEVTSISLSGRHWLNPDWGVSYEAIAEHQGRLYTRKGVRLGLRRAF